MSIVFPSHINEDAIVQTNQEHSVGTAEIARKNLETIGLGKTAFLSGLLHDCGKFTEEFREYLLRASAGENVQKGSVIHTFAGVSLLLKKFHTDKGDYADAAAEIMACAVGSHHGLFDCIDPNGQSGFLHRLRKQADYDEKAISNFFAFCCSEMELKHRWKESFEELKPVMAHCFDLGGDDSSETAFYIGLLCRLITSALIDGDRTDTMRFMTGMDPKASTQYDWEKCLDRIRDYLADFPADSEIQKARKNLSAACETAGTKKTGIYRLDMPTGAGKTLGGLRFAASHAMRRGKKRIIYVAPLLSILDQNATVIRAAVQDDTVILEHHSNVIKEDFDETELQKYELLSDNWDSPIVITTMVQFLNTLFGGKTTQVRRFCALCDSVILLDEVQSIPNKMLSLFNLSITFLTEICHATVVLCSATQPLFENEKIEHRLLFTPDSLLDKKVLEPYSNVFKRTRIIDKGNLRIEDIPDFAEELLEQNSSVLVVCNKKAEAEAIYNLCLDLPCRCFHLSASMCMRHRKDTLQQLTESLMSGEKVLCISTQVIEAGVDISFETVVRMTTGLDSIVQAAGRCNRNGEKESADVFIVNGSNEKLKGLNDIKKAQDAALQLLTVYKKDPERFGFDLAGQEAVNYYYWRLYAEMESGSADYPLNDGTSLYDLLAENESFLERSSEGNGNENYYLNQAFKTAGNKFEVLDSNQTSVVVHYGDSDELILQLCEAEKMPFGQQVALINHLKPYTVSIYDYQRRKYEEWEAIQYYMDGKVAVLDKNFYSDKIGLMTGKEENGRCSILIL